MKPGSEKFNQGPGLSEQKENAAMKLVRTEQFPLFSPFYTDVSSRRNGFFLEVTLEPSYCSVQIRISFLYKGL